MAGAETIFNAPIPGQSLTQDPASRGPWEMPPKFPTVNMAMDHMFDVVTSKNFMQNYNKLLMEDKKFYTDEIVAGMLEDGFLNGLWSVDTMVLLVEPLTILMVWCAAMLNKSPSFATDTGYEDRTGFEELSDAMIDSVDTEPSPEEAAAEEVEPQPQPIVEELQAQPKAAPVSPLVTGGM